jgi:hypothetical protein
MKQLILVLMLLLALPATTNARDFGRRESAFSERRNFSSGIDRAIKNELLADPFSGSGGGGDESGNLRAGSGEGGGTGSKITNQPIGEGLWLLVLGAITYCLANFFRSRSLINGHR